MLNEGIHDPAIFKVIFLAGGPGVGKSFVGGKTGLAPLGFRIVNSDDVYEIKMSQYGMKPTPENIYSPQGQSIRNNAKRITKKRLNLYLLGRLGIVVDGTGKDVNKIKRQISDFKKLGYDISMIYVNTDVETALKRNKERPRVLPDKQVKDMWLGVQKNIGTFQHLFGQNFHAIDNSEHQKGKNSTFGKQTTAVYKKISAWAKKSPTAPQAKDWIR